MNWVSTASGKIPEAPLLMPESIWQILFSRGFKTREEINTHLWPKLKNLTHPFDLKGMDKAIDRLVKALRAHEVIAIYGDYDLDGTPGVALLKTGFKSLGFKKVLVDQPLRLLDGYGLHAHKLKLLREQGVTLVVTVDVGITDVEAVQFAKTIGIDVIVTDHHLPKELLPSAEAIVNPNSGICSSRLHFLCGTGVAFYLILALKMKLELLGLLELDFNTKSLLDLFAIATVTDMVPLIGENRILLKHGLTQLQNTNRPGLKALLQSLNLYGKPLTTLDIGFRFAPKLNALSRLEEGLRPLDIFLASESTAPQLVEGVFAINDKRRLLQKSAESFADKNLMTDSGQNFYWVYSKDFHPGVISLVANSIMQKYNRPAFVGAVREDGVITCSSRAPKDSFNLQDVLSFASPVLHKFGGHALAAGFETDLEQADLFFNLLCDFFSRNSSSLKDSTASNDFKDGVYHYDAELKPSEWSLEWMSWYEALGPFGQGFKAPVLIMKNLKVKRCQELKKGKLKYYLQNDASGPVIEAPWFNKPVAFSEGSTVDIVFEPQWNDYMGRRTLQALILDMRLSTIH